MTMTAEIGLLTIMCDNITDPTFITVQQATIKVVERLSRNKDISISPNTTVSVIVYRKYTRVILFQ